MSYQATQTVFLLATVRNPALLEAALLVFKTIRTGFPTSNIHVTGNGLEVFFEQEVGHACTRIGATFANNRRTAHDEWIERLIMAGNGPMWICDTDVVFFGKVEGWFLDQWHGPMLAGRFEPEFEEEWTQTRHVARLHTSLMWLNIPCVRQAMRNWMGRFPNIWHTAQMNLIRQQFIPVAGQQPLFYDTCAGLYHAVGGHKFMDEQNAAFEHLHCATYSDVVTAPGLKDLADIHKLSLIHI